MKKFLNDFKKFITRGNILDLAVAVVIGSAFTKIVNSLVNDILTPIISLFTGEEGFSNYKYVITEANESLGIAENAIYYGTFLQNVIDFLIIAFIIFLIVKLITKTRKLVDDVQDNIKDTIQESKTRTDDLLLDIKTLLGKNLNQNKNDKN